MMPLNDTNPLVSVIMPTWNRAAIIGESIASVIGQTFQDWELIIVDDGSEDNTEEVVSRFKDDRIRFHKTGKTGLGIKLKYAGISVSSGAWIAFIDSDDCWAPDKLEKQLAALAQYPGAAFSMTGGYNFKKPGEPLEYFYRLREGIRYGDMLVPLFRAELALFPQTLLMKRDCLPLILHYVETAPHSDVEFMYGLAAHYKAVILYEPLLYRRIHHSNSSSADWEQGYRESIRMIGEYRKNKKLPAAVAREAGFRLYIHYGEKYLSKRKGWKAVRQFARAWRWRPHSIIPLKKTGKALWYALSGK